MINIVQQRDLGRQIMSVTEKTAERSGTDTDFREQMLLHNHPEGMLPFEVMTEDDEKRYEYGIGDKYTLEEYFRMTSPERENMACVLRQIMEIVYKGREYMLDENDYIIGPDTVFIDENSEVCLAYFPGYSHDLKDQLRDLAQYFMEIVDYTDESAVMLIYGFYMRTKEKGCSFEELLRCLGNTSDEKKKQEAGTDTKAAVSPEYDPRSVNSAEMRTDLITDIAGKRSYDRELYEAAGRSTEGQRKTIIKKENRREERQEENKPENPKNFQTKAYIQQVTQNAATSRSYEPGIQDRIYEIGKMNDPVKPDPNKVFSESPLRLKIIGFLLPPAAVLLLFMLFRSGILLNSDTGKNDMIRSLAAIILILGGCFEAERFMWKKFARKLGESIASAEKESEEATVFLYGNDTAGYPFSLVSDDQPAINVSHFPFFVGKDSRHCDYVMADQIGISRYHLKIDRDGEDFTISDLNSTNGTFINGERLAPHLPHKIRRGDELRIGKCIYYCN